MVVRFYDTNALLSLMDKAFDDFFACSDVTLRELEDIKTSSRKTDDLRYRARRVSHLLDKHLDRYFVAICTDKLLAAHGIDFDTPDMRIITSALYYRDMLNDDKELVFVSDDICCKNMARIYGLKVESVNEEMHIYKGYKELIGTTEEINNYFETYDKSDWHTNEYIIVSNTDDGSSFEMRFDGNEFVSLKLPPSKVIKAKNSLQRCALDILNNPKVTIAAILGGYGSGKTYISMRMALYAVREKGWQSKVLGVREPVSSGKEIGFLPGSKEDKLGNFFLPLEQQLDGGYFEMESLKQSGVLEINNPYFMKGCSYQNTVMIVDEAEDLTEKQIKLVGTRLGEDSRIIFAGDYKQSEIDATKSNGLVKMCDAFKGDEKFACIYLGEDVRSTTSKMFANLFTEE